MRDCLGYVLLRHGDAGNPDPAAALAEHASTLSSYPSSPWALLGAAEASEAIGRRQDAEGYAAAFRAQQAANGFAITSPCPQYEAEPPPSPPPSPPPPSVAELARFRLPSSSCSGDAAASSSALCVGGSVAGLVALCLALVGAPLHVAVTRDSYTLALVDAPQPTQAALVTAA